MPIERTSDWFAYGLSRDRDQADITNQFVAFGVAAGLGAIGLFILLLKRAFSNLGKAMAAVRSNAQPTSDAEFLLWGLGVMLTVHITDWFGITYFDQMYVVWFMQLAAISGISEALLREPQPALVEMSESQNAIEDEAQPSPEGAI
jgi:hypothetical protein